MKKKQKNKQRIFFITLCSILLIVFGIGGCLFYKVIYQPNVFTDNKKSQFIYIPTNSDFKEVLNILNQQHILINSTTFEWLASLKKYTNAIKPGKYRVLANMSNNKLINLLHAGIQEPINISLTGIRNKEQFIKKVSTKLEADSIAMKGLVGSKAILAQYQMTAENSLTLIIPKIYTFYWNTSAEQFIEKITKEYELFWTIERSNKAKLIGLTLPEITILASIVQCEQTRYNDEKSIIAGLYINRLRKDMLLQSDPTLIAAIGDYSITRVLNIDKEIDSPYNTYKYKGLPPGPICIADTSSIDAVLNYDKNNYIYMCAKEDFSGKHNFAINYKQHCLNAIKYRKELDKKSIIR